MSGKFDLSNYVDVAERVELFREKHPEGSLQTELVELPAAFADAFIAVTATARRAPDDAAPGIDMAWEPVPGKTPYTKDSELMNACTSAIGRAIVAVLAADTKRGMASADEVRNRAGKSEPDPDEMARLGTNKLKTEALELAGDPVKAKSLWAKTLENFQLAADAVVPLDQQDIVRTELKANAEVAQTDSEKPF